MRNLFIFLILLLASVAWHLAEASQGAQDGKTIELNLPMETVMFKDAKTMQLSVGIGSGACRNQNDPEGLFYFITDRGPNIDCKDDEKFIGKDMCKKGKVFPSPWFVPSIYALQLDFEKGTYTIEDIITIKGAEGLPITGLPNPFKSTDTEAAYSIDGKEIPFDPSGLDAESIVRLNDGSFWISDEYGPSLLHIAPDGRIITRLVPKGLAKDLEGASYTIVEAFPSIYMKRKLNRGMESVSISPDEKYLYTVMQSPLANPDSSAYKKSRNCRLLKLDAKTFEILGEYVYEMDTPDTFAKDPGQKQNGVKVSEMHALAVDKLLVLERITKTTKFYVIDLANATDIKGTAWDEIATSPSLEQTALSAASIAPVSKALAFNSDDVEGLPAKIEGIGLVGHEAMILINDNDFGIAGDSSSITKIKLDLNP